MFSVFHCQRARVKIPTISSTSVVQQTQDIVVCCGLQGKNEKLFALGAKYAA
jgi:hypothetical protein